jgi:integrase
MIEVRIRFKGARKRFDVADETRAEALRALARILAKAGVGAERAERLLTDASTAGEGEFRRIIDLAAELGNGGSVATPAKPSTGETVAQYADRWIADRERRGLSTIGTDRGRLDNYILPKVGDKPIAQVNANDLRALVEHLDDVVRAGTVHWSTGRKIWGLVTKMFADSCRSKVAALRVRDDNPARDVQGPDAGEPTAKQWLYPNEIAQLLACEGVPVRWRRLYALAAYLYVRPGELAALDWADVHTDLGYVFIHQALDLRTGRLKRTKTGHTRKVPIHPSLAPLLEAMKGAGRVVQNTHENRTSEHATTHGMPPLEDLAATLREHLWRAGVRRADIQVVRDTTKRVTFYECTTTGHNWA